MRPQSLKEAVERTLLTGDERICISEFLDEFLLHHGNTAEQQTMISEPPPVSGRQPLDAYVALSESTWHGVGDCRRCHIAFRRRLIFTETEPLRRGRFPTKTEGCAGEIA